VRLAEGAFRLAKKVKSGEYDLVILDEINVALNLKLISLEKVLELIKIKLKHVELVLTGRYAPKEIIDVADLTEMREVKYPFKRGCQARKE